MTAPSIRIAEPGHHLAMNGRQAPGQVRRQLVAPGAGHAAPEEAARSTRRPFLETGRRFLALQLAERRELDRLADPVAVIIEAAEPHHAAETAHGVGGQVLVADHVERQARVVDPRSDVIAPGPEDLAELFGRGLRDVPGGGGAIAERL